MPAPDLVTVYNLLPAIEENSRATMEQTFDHVFTRKNAVPDMQKVRPYIALKAGLGSQFRHLALCPDKNERYDQWALTLQLFLLTEPQNKEQENTLHPLFQAQVRAYMSTFAQSTWSDLANWPYHLIAEAMLETNSQDIVKAQDSGIETSIINFSGVVAIRNDAWPN